MTKGHWTIWTFRHLHPLSPLRLVPGLMCGWVAGEGEGGVDTEDRRLRPAECGYRDRDTGSQSTLRPAVWRIHSIHSIHSYTGMLCSHIVAKLTLETRMKMGKKLSNSNFIVKES